MSHTLVQIASRLAESMEFKEGNWILPIPGTELYIESPSRQEVLNTGLQYFIENNEEEEMQEGDFAEMDGKYSKLSEDKAKGKDKKKSAPADDDEEEPDADDEEEGYLEDYEEDGDYTNMPGYAEAYQAALENILENLVEDYDEDGDEEYEESDFEEAGMSKIPPGLKEKLKKALELAKKHKKAIAIGAGATGAAGMAGLAMRRGKKKKEDFEEDYDEASDDEDGDYEEGDDEGEDFEEGFMDSIKSGAGKIYSKGKAMYAGYQKAQKKKRLIKKAKNIGNMVAYSGAAGVGYTAGKNLVSHVVPAAPQQQSYEEDYDEDGDDSDFQESNAYRRAAAQKQGIGSMNDLMSPNYCAQSGTWTLLLESADDYYEVVGFSRAGVIEKAAQVIAQDRFAESGNQGLPASNYNRFGINPEAFEDPMTAAYAQINAAQQRARMLR